MGASTSTEQQKVSAEQREVENQAASTGALPMLRKAFSNLADPQTNAIPLKNLQQCFHITYKNSDFEAPNMPNSFPVLLDNLGSAIVDLFFVTQKEGVSWVEFVRGYNKCCGRMSASMSINTLLRVYATTVTKAGLPIKLEFDSDENGDCKICGSVSANDVVMLLWMCWTMWWDFRTWRISKERGKENPCLPDVSHIVLSAVVSCAEGGSGSNVWDCDVSGLEVEFPVGKFLTWAFKTVLSLPDCFTQFVHARLQYFLTPKDELASSSSSVRNMPSTKLCNSKLLTCGRAWAISLTLRSTMNEEILRLCFPSDGDGTDENLLYQSSLHGRGLNRFWSKIEGYKGPLLILVSASNGDSHEGSTDVKKWIIGSLTQNGFENRNMFYGSSGSLYAISPVFQVFSSTGKEKNFVYSHVHPTGKIYEPQRKPVGIAFGGTMGNERIFVDEDFAKVTVRHHATDKTYQPGSLFPDQGFLPVEALISEVEVWGLGGSAVKQVQSSYKKREELFTDQRRKVDLKTFASWDDSPEKMMMDMVSDPNAVRREDR
uniref:TLDc domain-containing protein n=1 Tax=Fagus sylvatica TaxID=28930 RepID=A0A2N9EE08_FAGSY